jgi:hypothetical protein
MNNLVKFFCVQVIAVFMALVLQGCVSVQAKEPEEDASASLREIVPHPAILIDGVPHRKEQVEKLASIWNDASTRASLSFDEQFRAEFNAYMDYLLSLTVVPSPDNAEVNAFLDRLSASAAAFNTGFFSMRSLVSARLETCVIAEGIPYEIAGTGHFEDLFQSIPMIMVEGSLYPASVISHIQESMAEVSSTQWASLSGSLEAALTNMYSRRKANSKDFTKWVYNWTNFWSKSTQELAGTWADKYSEQYTARINKGIDTGLPQRRVLQFKEKADILLIGYINVLACCGTPITSENEMLIAPQQTMGYEELFAPYTLMMKACYTGEILGIDISGWRQETNNRIGGAIGVIFTAVDIAGIILSKGNPIVLVIEGLDKIIKAVWHLLTKGGKAAKLEAEIKTGLNNELNQLLAALRNIPEFDVQPAAAGI